MSAVSAHIHPYAYRYINIWMRGFYSFFTYFFTVDVYYAPSVDYAPSVENAPPPDVAISEMGWGYIIFRI